MSVQSTTVATNRRLPTLRSMGSTISSIASTDEDVGGENKDAATTSSAAVAERISAMTAEAKAGTPLTDEELQGITNGLSNLLPANSPVDMDDVTTLLREVAHLSHKDWAVTSQNSDKLCRSLSAASDDVSEDSYPLAPHMRQLLERILQDGNWQGAVAFADQRRASSSGPEDNNNQKPWAVLVTGVNGIRKTTSMYQPWFGTLLSEALIVPEEVGGGGGVSSKSPRPSPVVEALPTGSNSFFRQLDHMIATLCNEEFYRLYAWSASQLKDENNNDKDPPVEVVEQYSDYKAAIFSRYRTLSELLGALLLKQAQLININCLMETSGRDVAMFHYVDHFFPSSSNYNKLALHFTINDLACAQQSVDRRMIHEIQAGAKAVETGDAFSIVYTNEGGPYGSKVLPGVQKDSDHVWESQVMTGAVGKDWYKATIAIEAHLTEPWTARAVRPDGSLGTKFTFEPRNA